MPKGETSRPYNKVERDMAAAKKKLQNSPRGKSLSQEEGEIGLKHNMPDRGKTKKGPVMGLVGSSGDGSRAVRETGAAVDKQFSNDIRSGKRDSRGNRKRAYPE